MPRERIEEPGLSPKEKVARLVAGIEPLENTIQYSWLIEMAREFFGFADERITPDNWEALYDRAAAADGRRPIGPSKCSSRAGSRRCFSPTISTIRSTASTRSVYVPCLRTDDLVFHLAKPEVRAAAGKGHAAWRSASPASMRQAIGKLFEHFTRRGARACAISLPPRLRSPPVSSQGGS